MQGEEGSTPVGGPFGRLDDGQAERAEAEAAEVASATAASGEPAPDPNRSVRPATCPYLRLLAADGALARPADAVTEGHCCIAMGEAALLSERQQGLVCLTTAHRDCPRYLRAILAIPVTEPVVPTRRRVHPATLVATVLLALSTVAAVAFTAARGGIAMPSASALQPSASEVAAASRSPGSPSSSPKPSETTAASPSLGPSPSPTPAPSPSRTPRPSPSRSPRPSATPAPTSDRYQLLEACPDKPDCWIYTVRSGDNLFSIANYFGVPLATVYRLNPWTRTAGLRAGQELILPPPTR